MSQRAVVDEEGDGALVGCRLSVGDGLKLSQGQ
jgi:hypothetical protein